jgi:hypothetical protein
MQITLNVREWRYEPGDESVDAQYVCAGTNYAIQVCPYARDKYVVNEYGPNMEQIEWVRTLGEFRTLGAAKQFVFELTA